ncbi:uncharacterized protein EAE98_001429 [Botrytis deweyae]|nr:uncharacterized protein EAE98_001429 [Botrytis deweyae]KAF7915922.1 hypothetical protein EAE99_009926 [Botrytis elliptica]KAF7937115.1 hypothetical protein EAE98_001429 [Botrytis deweyae]
MASQITILKQQITHDDRKFEFMVLLADMTQYLRLKHFHRRPVPRTLSVWVGDSSGDNFYGSRETASLAFDQLTIAILHGSKDISQPPSIVIRINLCENLIAMSDNPILDGNASPQIEEEISTETTVIWQDIPMPGFRRAHSTSSWRFDRPRKTAYYHDTLKDPILDDQELSSLSVVSSFVKFPKIIRVTKLQQM